ncbi:MAG TPA: lysophospholipid acyltransferase family protein [Pseudomonadales bacterium]|nr:lysophospholipid acyltransferase family protein [Pseudomonadales bacterium]HND13549.1 lysophospholipid acyltransferase family protein [Pseudomonadales bacterium]
MLLAFLRSVLFYAGYGLSVIVWGVVILVVAPWLEYPQRFRLVTLWNRFSLRWCGLACGVRYRIEGLQNLPAHGCVIIANHQSSWETIFLATLFPRLCVLLKRELLRIPFFGWALKMLNPIAIDRGNPRAALRQLMEGGVQRLADDCSVLIFPEGTRVDAGEPLRFSRSAAQLAIQAGVEIVCVAHDAGKCWPARRFLKTPGVINVVVSAPLPSAGSDAGSLTRQAQDWIQQQLERFATQR